MNIDFFRKLFEALRQRRSPPLVDDAEKTNVFPKQLFKKWMPSAGPICDFATVAPSTDHDKRDEGINLFTVEQDTPGFSARLRFVTNFGVV